MRSRTVIRLRVRFCCGLYFSEPGGARLLTLVVCSTINRSLISESLERLPANLVRDLDLHQRDLRSPWPVTVDGDAPLRILYSVVESLLNAAHTRKQALSLIVQPCPINN